MHETKNQPEAWAVTYGVVFKTRRDTKSAISLSQRTPDLTWTAPVDIDDTANVYGNLNIDQVSFVQINQRNKNSGLSGQGHRRAVTAQAL